MTRYKSRIYYYSIFSLRREMRDLLEHSVQSPFSSFISSTHSERESNTTLQTDLCTYIHTRGYELPVLVSNRQCNPRRYAYSSEFLTLANGERTGSYSTGVSSVWFGLQQSNEYFVFPYCKKGDVCRVCMYLIITPKPENTIL